MQDFRTAITIPQAKHKIDLKKPILSIGSCFSRLIGQKLLNHKFSILLNPFGTLFNPITIFDLLEISIKNQKPSVFADLYIKSQSLWKHYCLHSDFASLSKIDLDNSINQTFQDVHDFFEIPEEKVILMTLGTAWVYNLKETQTTVANCHKTPASFFDKKLLTLEVIEHSFEKLIHLLQQKNVKVILTVSPVRHIKEGLANNQISKAILRLFCENMSQKYDVIDYFPSYEIMLDDLRDYRFYASDLIHPNETAENYIWQKFQETYFDNETQVFVKNWQKILKQLQHKPLYISPAYLDFLEKTLLKLQSFASIINISSEKEFLEREIEKTSSTILE